LDRLRGQSSQHLESMTTVYGGHLVLIENLAHIHHPLSKQPSLPGSLPLAFSFARVSISLSRFLIRELWHWPSVINKASQTANRRPPQPEQEPVNMDDVGIEGEADEPGDEGGPAVDISHETHHPLGWADLDLQFSVPGDHQPCSHLTPPG